MMAIELYNCDGLCIQEFCSKRYTRMTTQTVRGMKLILGFCDKHAEEFENAS